MRRFVSSDIASIESTTPAIDSRPTSGTIIGGCGAIPEKTRLLELAIVRLSYFGGNGCYSSSERTRLQLRGVLIRVSSLCSSAFLCASAVNVRTQRYAEKIRRHLQLRGERWRNLMY